MLPLSYCKQTRFLYPVKIFFKYAEEIKIFLDKQKLIVLVSRKAMLQETLEKGKKDTIWKSILMKRTNNTCNDKYVSKYF